MSYSDEYLGKTVTIKIDRPLGTKHPKHSYYYAVNYGYVPNTMAPDGSELDAYVLGVYKPVEEFIGKCIAVIKRDDDDDDKLIVVPEDVSLSDEQIYAKVEFQERFFTSKIIR